MSSSTKNLLCPACLRTADKTDVFLLPCDANLNQETQRLHWCHKSCMIDDTGKFKLRTCFICKCNLNMKTVCTKNYKTKNLIFDQNELVDHFHSYRTLQNNEKYQMLTADGTSDEDEDEEEEDEEEDDEEEEEEGEEDEEEDEEEEEEGEGEDPGDSKMEDEDNDDDLGQDEDETSDDEISIEDLSLDEDSAPSPGQLLLDSWVNNNFNIMQVGSNNNVKVSEKSSFLYADSESVVNYSKEVYDYNKSPYPDREDYKSFSDEDRKKQFRYTFNSKRPDREDEKNIHEDISSTLNDITNIELDEAKEVYMRKTNNEESILRFLDIEESSDPNKKLNLQRATDVIYLLNAFLHSIRNLAYIDGSTEQLILKTVKNTLKDALNILILSSFVFHKGNNIYGYAYAAQIMYFHVCGYREIDNSNSISTILSVLNTADSSSARSFEELMLHEDASIFCAIVKQINPTHFRIYEGKEFDVVEAALKFLIEKYLIPDINTKGIAGRYKQFFQSGENTTKVYKSDGSDLDIFISPIHTAKLYNRLTGQINPPDLFMKTFYYGKQTMSDDYIQFIVNAKFAKNQSIKKMIEDSPENSIFDLTTFVKKKLKPLHYYFMLDNRAEKIERIQALIDRFSDVWIAASNDESVKFMEKYKIKSSVIDNERRSQKGNVLYIYQGLALPLAVLLKHSLSKVPSCMNSNVKLDKNCAVFTEIEKGYLIPFNRKYYNLFFNLESFKSFAKIFVQLVVSTLGSFYSDKHASVSKIASIKYTARTSALNLYETKSRDGVFGLVPNANVSSESKRKEVMESVSEHLKYLSRYESPSTLFGDTYKKSILVHGSLLFVEYICQYTASSFEFVMDILANPDPNVDLYTDILFELFETQSRNLLTDQYFDYILSEKNAFNVLGFRNVLDYNEHASPYNDVLQSRILKIEDNHNNVYPTGECFICMEDDEIFSYNLNKLKESLPTDQQTNITEIQRLIQESREQNMDLYRCDNANHSNYDRIAPTTGAHISCITIRDILEENIKFDIKNIEKMLSYEANNYVCIRCQDAMYGTCYACQTMIKKKTYTLDEAALKYVKGELELDDLNKEMVNKYSRIKDQLIAILDKIKGKKHGDIITRIEKFWRDDSDSTFSVKKRVPVSTDIDELENIFNDDENSRSLGSTLGTILGQGTLERKTKLIVLLLHKLANKKIFKKQYKKTEKEIISEFIEDTINTEKAKYDRNLDDDEKKIAKKAIESQFESYAVQQVFPLYIANRMINDAANEIEETSNGIISSLNTFQYTNVKYIDDLIYADAKSPDEVKQTDGSKEISKAYSNINSKKKTVMMDYSRYEYEFRNVSFRVLSYIYCKLKYDDKDNDYYSTVSCNGLNCSILQSESYNHRLNKQLDEEASMLGNIRIFHRCCSEGYYYKDLVEITRIALLKSSDAEVEVDSEGEEEGREDVDEDAGSENEDEDEDDDSEYIPQEGEVDNEETIAIQEEEEVEEEEEEEEDEDEEEVEEVKKKSIPTAPAQANIKRRLPVDENSEQNRTKAQKTGRSGKGDSKSSRIITNAIELMKGLLFKSDFVNGIEKDGCFYCPSCRFGCGYKGQWVIGESTKRFLNFRMPVHISVNYSENDDEKSHHTQEEHLVQTCFDTIYSAVPLNQVLSELDKYYTEPEKNTEPISNELNYQLIDKSDERVVRLSIPFYYQHTLNDKPVYINKCCTFSLHQDLETYGPIVRFQRCIDQIIQYQFLKSLERFKNIQIEIPRVVAWNPDESKFWDSAVYLARKLNSTVYKKDEEYTRVWNASLYRGCQSTGSKSPEGVASRNHCLPYIQSSFTRVINSYGIASNSQLVELIKTNIDHPYVNQLYNSTYGNTYFHYIVLHNIKSGNTTYDSYLMNTKKQDMVDKVYVEYNLNMDNEKKTKRKKKDGTEDEQKEIKEKSPYVEYYDLICDLFQSINRVTFEYIACPKSIPGGIMPDPHALTNIFDKPHFDEQDNLLALMVKFYDGRFIIPNELASTRYKTPLSMKEEVVKNEIKRKRKGKKKIENTENKRIQEVDSDDFGVFATPEQHKNREVDIKSLILEFKEVFDRAILDLATNK